jgi:uncharacterized protein
MDSASPLHERPHPISPDERIDVIDVVRGFALFGVLLANLVWLTTDVVLSDARLSQLPTAPLDRMVKPLVVFFVDQKFYTLFSFLFGVGFALQRSRAEAGRYAVSAVYARRVSILAIIGLLHITFVWYGDILLVYAIGGFGLLLARRWNARLLIGLAVTIALFGRAGVGIIPVIEGATARPYVDAKAQEDLEKEHRLAVFAGASYGAIVRENADLYFTEFAASGVGVVFVWQVFARFLLGLYVGQRNWPRRMTELRPHLRRLLPWAVGIGVLGNGMAMLLGHLQGLEVIGRDASWVHAAEPIEEAGILALAFSYLSALVLLFHRSASWRRRLGHLAPVGRMALTNYLTQSALYVLLFTGVGVGLYGKVGPAWCVVLACLIFAAQMLVSRWWLTRYRFGPVEWMWRTLTYGALQPMRATCTNPHGVIRHVE